jgi:hypothetical protein
MFTNCTIYKILDMCVSKKDIAVREETTTKALPLLSCSIIVFIPDN